MRSSESCLGVVVPVYNEIRWIDELFERVLARPEVGEVAAVDDGSRDGSWESLWLWAGRDSRVRVLRHESNRGKGAAIRTALGELKSGLILIQDADLEYDPADYAVLVAPALSGAADVVYGSRFAGMSSGDARWHRVGNVCLTWACNRLTGLRLTDEATCYKLFRREVLELIELVENGFGFCPEVTAKVAKLVRDGTVRLVEAPVSYRARTLREGKKIRLRDGLTALWCLWKYSR
jgi:glycosyltransferase involved in cell wall biosynthesis